jgi:phosphoserine/homoserine phosphotransferase
MPTTMSAKPRVFVAINILFQTSTACRRWSDGEKWILSDGNGQESLNRHSTQFGFEYALYIRVAIDNIPLFAFGGRVVEIACLDLEGVLIPEIWINFAKATGIEALRLTTRDVADYDELMQHRLRILDENNFKLSDIQAVIGDMGPMEGAPEFMDWLRERFQVAILSDTFYEFSAPLMPYLGSPILLCHRLSVDKSGRVVDYHLRQKDPKRQSVKAFHSLNYRTIATGDSYNDTTMLEEADAGILFKPPQNVIDEFPQYPVAMDYETLKAEFLKASERF